jgi:hypothetical protein
MHDYILNISKIGYKPFKIDEVGGVDFFIKTKLYY